MMTKKICVYGVVQGVGFRPFIAKLAKVHQIFGSVCNKGSFVEIFAQGDDVMHFAQNIETKKPSRATILKIDVQDVATEKIFSQFTIIESDTRHEIQNSFVSPDIATCPTCAKELFDPNNRRYLHPFINCTACGPRLTILENMPYDRERTSMKSFAMCAPCAKEYYSPKSRRYDAQPVCCPDCGPEIFLLNKKAFGHEAIKIIRKKILNGELVAIKGIGGFHLCCDATNDEAVKRLREKKNRPFKPLAIMAKNWDAVQKICRIPNNRKREIKKIMTGPEKPILFLEKINEENFLAPCCEKLGVMLPYAPIHYLLFDFPDDDLQKNGEKKLEFLVMTSGNLSGSPMAKNDDEAREMLLRICDEENILTHNRDIYTRADDSVVALDENNFPVMIRRSRGYAPLPIVLNQNFHGEVLALGAEIKNTFCLAKDDFFYPSAYLGDMAHTRTQQARDEAIFKMQNLFKIFPKIVACDKHPNYFANNFLPTQNDTKIIPVQHHFAHLVSCLAEHNFSGDVLGVVFDGTGYGDDKTIWGGEFFKGNLHSYQRIGAMQPFAQAGGERAVRQPWRIAANLLFDACHHDVEKSLSLAQKRNLGSKEKILSQFFMQEKNINCVKSTSIGRLFDGVSALLGFCIENQTCEGEAAMRLEFFARKNKRKKFFFPHEKILTKENFFELNTKDLFQELLQQSMNGEDPIFLADYFHEILADEILQACLFSREKFSLETVALSGGVFQNFWLVQKVLKRLEQNNFQVLTHKKIPPNDGGISLGQAVYAMTCQQ